MNEFVGFMQWFILQFISALALLFLGFSLLKLLTPAQCSLQQPQQLYQPFYGRPMKDFLCICLVDVMPATEAVFQT